uniref:R3H domain-containing protein n=1 Tax=Caenorhabditis japonica TaxID=281687 RepID=A0A8R1HPZ2_CAEJA
MSSENVPDGATDEVKPSAERRRSTTVIMSANVVTMPEEVAEGPTTGVRRNGSMRRRLSKQNATIEEPISLLSISGTPSDEIVPCIEEHPEEEDDTKLRPPVSSVTKKLWTSSKSLSRESNGTEYSDRSGTDLRGFVERTLHKSEEDRKQLLDFELELKSLILDESIQSKKFELSSSYHRMLLHRCAAWFGLDHNVTNKRTDIVVNKSEKTKIPDENFSDYIRHDNYSEDRFKRQNTSESFNEPNSLFGSQASLNHELLMTQRAHSFEVSGPPVLQTRGLPMRQLSLNCSQPPMVAAPLSSGHQHQWAPQRSFDCSNNSYLVASTRQPQQHAPMMRKAESFGGMAMGCYEPMVCQPPVQAPAHTHTPPNVMVHHHHHHAHPHPHSHPHPHPHTQPNYTGYQVFDEMAMPEPYYVPTYTRPVQYVQRPQTSSSGVQYVYGPPPAPAAPHAPQYMAYPPEVRVDTFPQITQFHVPGADQQGYASSHQAETANSFIKASIDGGYGSMNHEADSGSNGDKSEE